MSDSNWNFVSRRKFVLTGSALTASTATWAFLGSSSAMAAAKKVASKGSRTGSKASPTAPIEIPALGRLTYGYREKDAQSFRAGGKTPRKQLESFLDQQLSPATIDDASCDKRIADLKLTTAGKTLTALWKEHGFAANAMREQAKEAGKEKSAALTGEAEKNLKQQENALRFAPVNEVEKATWVRAVYSERQLLEVVTEFWHDHFSVNGFDQNIGPVFVHYDRDVIRSNVLGNFHELLTAVAKSPAMLFYLDNTVNQSGNPNENYARELFELHTLGAENYLGTGSRESVQGFASGHSVGYVDGDVYEAARCFTGWRVDAGNKSEESGAFQYFEQWHDRFQKIVLGQRLPEYQGAMSDGEKVLDLLSEHHGTATYVARKLARRLVSDNPSESLVKAAAKVFYDERKSKDQISKVVRFIVLSDEFQGTSGERMKRPFNLIAGVLRATGADFSPTEDFLNQFQKTGQRRFAWKTPDGYPDVRDKWSSAGTMIERWRLTNQIIQNKIEGIKVDLSGWGAPRAKTPDNIQDWLAKNILGFSAGALTRQTVTQYLANGRNHLSAVPDGLYSDRCRGAAALMLLSPEFQVI